MRQSLQVLIAAISLVAASYATADLIAPCVADTTVRGDLQVRMNDNYGMDYEVMLGSSRGGYGPWGSADAMRSLLKFDFSGIDLQAGVASANLRMTNTGVIPPLPLPYTIEVHRILDNWIEGNGSGAGVDVNDAYGVAWAAIDANNQEQPGIDPAVSGSLTLIASPNSGQVLNFDITALVQLWASGSPNYGLELISLSTNGDFYQFGMVSREGAGGQYPTLSPPEITIALIPEPSALVVIGATTLLTLRARKSS